MAISLNISRIAKSPLPDFVLPAADAVGLYVHIPFCFHKCHYCDFYSITKQTPERMAEFVDRILIEAEMWVEQFQSVKSADRPATLIQPRTIFFGGGTPSLLPIDQMHRLIDQLAVRFDFSQVNEWTIECNPATVTLEYLQMLKSTGVNRLSFGAQSFDRHDLVMLERHHDPEDVPRSISLARTAGFDRLNLDLIYAVPGQSLASWLNTLEQAIHIGTTHLSCYGLTYEPNTPMAVKKRLGQIKAVDEDIELQMLHATRARLREKGFSPYEVSNFSQPNQECRHNLMYWAGDNYIGLGPSAASHVEGVRWKNRGHIGDWESAIDDRLLPIVETETLTPEHRARELIYLQLRLANGINFAQFKSKTNFDAQQLFAGQLKQLSKQNLLIVHADGFHVSETGINVLDAISAEFLNA